MLARKVPEQNTVQSVWFNQQAATTQKTPCLVPEQNSIFHVAEGNEKLER